MSLDINDPKCTSQIKLLTQIINTIWFNAFFSTGVRSPDLQNGGDLQFVMMDNDDFLYDSSMPSVAYGSTNLGKGLWPYTFDYASIQVTW